MLQCSVTRWRGQGLPEKEIYPIGVYMPKPGAKLLSRLSRLEGQVRGDSRMLPEERYCLDVLDHVQAIKAALRKVEDEILKAHSDHCVAHAIESGNAADARQKFAELADLFSRYAR